MKLINVTEDFSVDPQEIAALESFESWKQSSSPSGDSHLDHSGTIVILKCGRKVYVKNKTVKEITNLFSPMFR